MLETGVDIIEIDRIEAAIARHGRRFLERVFTEAELEQCQGRVQSLAARFAAKEATVKALGARAAWIEIEVHSEPSGKPHLILRGRARLLADERGLGAWSVSLSHSRTHAVAMVVASGQKGGGS